MTNRLRTEGTDHLLAAGRAVGARRFVAQSFGAFRWARTGGPVLTEADPIDPNPPGALRVALVGILHRRAGCAGDRVGRRSCVALWRLLRPRDRISHASDAVMAAPVRKRQFPIVGDGGGVWSHIHIDDAVAATLAAVDHGEPGVYNIVDDEPAPVREWLRRSRARWMPATEAYPTLAGAAGGRRDGNVDDDRVAGGLERQGQARARLEASLCELAAGVRAGARLSDDRGGVRRAPVRRRSPSSSRARGRRQLRGTRAKCRGRRPRRGGRLGDLVHARAHVPSSAMTAMRAEEWPG